MNSNVKLKFVCYGTAQLWQSKENPVTSKNNVAPFIFDNNVKFITNQYHLNTKTIDFNESFVPIRNSSEMNENVSEFILDIYC